MGSIKTYLANGPEITKARLAKGFLSMESFIDYAKSKGIKISLDTLRRCENSPHEEDHHSFYSTFETLSNVFAVPIKKLMVGATDEELAIRGVVQPKIGAGVFRDCSGVWQVTGKDITVEKYFEYPSGPKNLEAKVKIEVDATASTISANGYDHDKDPLSFEGFVLESGNHIVGKYVIENNRLHVYGTVNLQFHSCGKKMTGFYVGRETGHGSIYILGELLMTLIENKSNL